MCTFTKFDKKIIVSNHAKERAVQMIRLYLKDDERRNPESFLVNDFIRSVQIQKSINCPFYKNRWGGTMRSESGLLTYVYKEYDDHIVIITAMMLESRELKRR